MPATSLSETPSHKRPWTAWPWRSLAFFAGILLYGCIGAPTPDGIGAGEAVIGVLLVAAISIPVLETVPAAAFLLLAYGLSIPLLTGIASGHNPGAIARDLVPFLFLLLPVLYRPAVEAHRTILAWVITVVGFLFAWRSLLPYRDVLLRPDIWLGQPPADLLYLANSPEVLFAALMLLGTGAYLIWSRQSVVAGFALWAAAAIPLLAMAVMMQRAGLGCVMLSGLVLSAIGFYLRPARSVLTLLLIGALALPFISLGDVVARALVGKTEMVGFNSRVQEWQTVLGLISGSPWTLLFGTGWGMVFENPAVGNLPVNYTHSLISAILLKSGVAGVAVLLIYLIALTLAALPALMRRPVLLLALGAPLAIGVLFYASYKSLGFGLLLLLLSVYRSDTNLDKNQQDMS